MLVLVMPVVIKNVCYKKWLTRPISRDKGVDQLCVVPIIGQPQGRDYRFKIVREMPKMAKRRKSRAGQASTR